jgi:hypothetical protein
LVLDIDKIKDPRYVPEAPGEILDLPITSDDY